MSVGSILAQTKENEDWLDSTINRLPIANNDRNRFVGSMLDQTQHHARAIRLLVEHGEHDERDGQRSFGPACTLLRPTFERLLRAYWLKHDAKDTDLKKFEQEKVPNAGKIINMIKARAASPNDPLAPTDNILVATYDRYWEKMCSYAHGGYHPTVRNLTGDTIESNYDPEEAEEVVKAAAILALLAAVELFAQANRGDLIVEAVKRIGKIRAST